MPSLVGRSATRLSPVDVPIQATAERNTTCVGTVARDRVAGSQGCEVVVRDIGARALARVSMQAAETVTLLNLRGDGRTRIGSCNGAAIEAAVYCLVHPLFDDPDRQRMAERVPAHAPARRPRLILMTRGNDPGQQDRHRLWLSMPPE